MGADLVYVFCAKEAGVVIKSYSPELIVLPILDQLNAVEHIEPWLERLHVVLIGPGLGRLPSTFAVIEGIINTCRSKKKPLVSIIRFWFKICINVMYNIIKNNILIA